MTCLQGLSTRTQALLDQLDVMQERDRRKRRSEKLRKALSPIDHRADIRALVVATTPKPLRRESVKERVTARSSTPSQSIVAVTSTSSTAPAHLQQATFHQQHNAARMQQKIQEIRNERKQHDNKLKSAASANATEEEIRAFRHHTNRIAAFRQAEQRLRSEQDSLEEQMDYVQSSLAPRGLSVAHVDEEMPPRTFLIGERVLLKPFFILQDVWEAMAASNSTAGGIEHLHEVATLDELADVCGRIGTISHVFTSKKVTVTFSHAQYHERRAYTIPSSALQLLSDPTTCGAPVIATPAGDVFELLSVDVTLEIVGDAAVLTHRTSWVPPRRLQLLTDTVEAAVIAPLVDGGQLTAFQADVGESRLRSVALLDEDGIDIIRRTCRARQLRLQKGQAALQVQQQPVDLESTRGADVSIGGGGVPAMPKLSTPNLLQQCAPLTPSVASGKMSSKDDDLLAEDDDPLHYIHKDGANPIMFRNPFGVWHDAFDSLEANYSPGQRSTVIPLKEHRCNELIHLTLQYHLAGTVCVRSAQPTAPAAAEADAPAGGHHRTQPQPHHHQRPPSSDQWSLRFTFPSKFPSRCLPSGRRSFDEISSFTVVVCGMNSKMFRLESYPSTTIDMHPPAKYSHHILAQKSGPWYNTGEIDVFLTAHRTSLEVEFAGILDSGSAVPGVDSFVLAAVIPPTHSSCEVLMRRCVALILDLEHDGISAFCSIGGTVGEQLDIRSDVLDAISCLIRSLAPNDFINVCVLDGTSLWAYSSSLSAAQSHDLSKAQSSVLTSFEYSLSNDAATGAILKSSSFRARAAPINGSYVEVGQDVNATAAKVIHFITACRSGKPTNLQADVAGWLRAQVQPLVKLGEHDHRVQKQQEDSREVFIVTAAALREEARVKISAALPALTSASIHIHTVLVQPYFSAPPLPHSSAVRGGEDDAAVSEGGSFESDTGVSRALSEKLLLTSHFWRAVANHTRGHHAHISHLHTAAVSLHTVVGLTAHPISGDVVLTLPGVDDITLHDCARPFTRLGVSIWTGSYGLPGTQKFSTAEAANFTCQTSRSKKLMKRANLVRLAAGLSQCLLYKNIRAEVDRVWLPYHLTAAGANNPGDEFFVDPLLVETRVNIACKFNSPLPHTAVLPLVFLDRDESGGYAAAADPESCSEGDSKPESPVEPAAPAVIPPAEPETARLISSFCQATVGLYVYFLFGAKNDSEAPVFSVVDTVQLAETTGALPGAAALSQSTNFTASRDLNRKKLLSQMLENGVFTRIRASFDDKICDEPARVTVTGKLPSKFSSNLTLWSIRQANDGNERAFCVRADEHAALRLLEKEEFIHDVQLQYDFHRLRIQIQLLEVHMKRSLCELEEEERLLRADLLTVQLKFWERLEAETSAERIDVRRVANVLRDHRLRLSYEEEEERHLIASDQGLMWIVAQFAVHGSAAPADIQYSLVILEHFYAISTDCVSFVATALALWMINPQAAAAFGTEPGAISQIREALEKHVSPSVVQPLLQVVHSFCQVRSNHGKLEACCVVRDVLAASGKGIGAISTQVEAVRTLAALATVSQAMRMTITNHHMGLRSLLQHLHLYMANRSYVSHILTLLLELASEQSSHGLISSLGCQVLSTCTALVHRTDWRIRALYFKVIGAVASSRSVRMTLVSNSQPIRIIFFTLQLCLGDRAAPMNEREGHLRAAAEALRCVRRMIGNVSEFPASQLALTLTATLRDLVAAEAEIVVREADLVRLILGRFSMVPSSDEQRPHCDLSMMPMFRAWSSLTVIEDPVAFTMMGCCYGLLKRARLVLGGVETSVVVRIFSRDSLVQNINPYDAHSGVTISVEEAERRLNPLYFCLLSLQLEDALENSVVCPPNQLQCLGFTSTANGTHATIFAMPPRYSLRFQLASLRSKGQTMILSAFLQLIVVLMEQLAYLAGCGGRVHGALDLDNLFSDDDFSLHARPRIVVGPSAAIPPDVIGLVPDPSLQTLLDPEDFAEAGAQTALDDERDVHRTILEALNYGAEIDEGNDVDYLLNKIPSSISNLVFGLSRCAEGSTMGDSGLSGRSISTVQMESTMEPSSMTSSPMQRFTNTPRQVRDALSDEQLLAWASSSGVPF